MTIETAAARLRRREISSVELTTDCLRQIEQRNPELNAFLTVTADQALAQARRCDQELASGHDRGPLHGIPYSVKDVFCTAGIRTTVGSTLFSDFIPDHDAAVVERLTHAGAVLLGKTGMHELAYGITSSNPHFGPVRNPRNPEHIPGGSSGGSAAAVAAGMSFFSLGSDTGGSIRIPAAYCGIVGIKPTTGRVSRYGVLPLDFTLDHMGPLTLSVRDAALVLQAIAGHDFRDDSSSREPVPNYLPGATSLAGLRVGLPRNFYLDAVTPAVAASVEAMTGRARELGAEIIPVDVPDIQAINAVGRVILLSEASALLEPYLDDRSRFGPDVLALLDQGRFLPATDYINAQRLRRVMQQQFQQLWDQVDCLFTPTTPAAAPKIGATRVEIAGRDEDVRLAATRLVRGCNVLGVPALSVPAGSDEEGMPLGLQIIAAPFAEPLLFQVGAAIETTLS